jgi:hypothetical protein
MKTKTVTETELVKAAVESATKDKAGRLNQLETKLETLLDGATSHPEIREAMPKCKDFFKSLTSDEFVQLLDGKSNIDPVYIALWYHYGETMHKAIGKCALGYKGRMTLLYPLWRLYADESDTYI